MNTPKNGGCETNNPSPPFAVAAPAVAVSAMPLPPQIASYFGPLQLLGYLACGVSFAAFFAGSHRRFLMVGATGSMIWALHYHLLGERVAAALSALSGGRNTIATRVHALRRGYRIALTVALCSVVASLTLYAASGPLAALPAFASCLSTTASFWLVGRAFRRTSLVSDSCWLLFGVLAGTTAGWIAASISLCLNLWTMRREAAAGAGAPAPAA